MAPDKDTRLLKLWIHYPWNDRVRVDATPRIDPLKEPFKYEDGGVFEVLSCFKHLKSFAFTFEGVSETHFNSIKLRVKNHRRFSLMGIRYAPDELVDTIYEFDNLVIERIN